MPNDDEDQPKKRRKRRRPKRKQSYQVGDSVDVIRPSRVKIDERGRLLVTPIAASELRVLRLDVETGE